MWRPALIGVTAVLLAATLFPRSSAGYPVRVIGNPRILADNRVVIKLKLTRRGRTPVKFVLLSENRSPIRKKRVLKKGARKVTLRAPPPGAYRLVVTAAIPKRPAKRLRNVEILIGSGGRLDEIRNNRQG